MSNLEVVGTRSLANQAGGMGGNNVQGLSLNLLVPQLSEEVPDSKSVGMLDRVKEMLLDFNVVCGGTISELCDALEGMGDAAPSHSFKGNDNLVYVSLTRVLNELKSIVDPEGSDFKKFAGSFLWSGSGNTTFNGADSLLNLLAGVTGKHLYCVPFKELLFLKVQEINKQGREFEELSDVDQATLCAYVNLLKLIKLLQEDNRIEKVAAAINERAAYQARMDIAHQNDAEREAKAHKEALMQRLLEAAGGV